MFLLLLLTSITIVTQHSNMCYIIHYRNNASSTGSSSTIMPSSSITMDDHVPTPLTDVIHTTSYTVHSITDTIVSSIPDDNVTTTVPNVTNTTHSDNVTHSTSSLHTTGDHTAVPSTLENGTVESSHDIDNASRVNVTKGSGDPVMPTPTNTSDVAMVMSHSNSTEEEYDNGEEETFTDSLPTQPPAAGQQQQKSSVLIRLSNRIKELEVNMSLFGDYLERVRTRCVIV